MQPLLSAGPLAEVFLAAALASAMTLMGIYIPPVSGLAQILWTVPISLLMVKRNIPLGFLALGVTLAVALFLSPPLLAGSFIAQYALVGIYYGVALKKNWRPGIVVSGGIVIAILSLAASIIITFRSAGIPLTDLGQPLEGIYSQTMSLYEQLGVLDRMAAEGVSRAEFELSIRQMVETFKRLLPGLLAVGAMGTAVVNYLMTYLIGQRMGLGLRKAPPFSQWHLPWHFTWGVVIGLAALLGGDYWQYQSVKVFGQNLLLVFAPVLLVFGLSVAAFYYQKSSLPRWLKIGLIVIGFFYLSFSLVMLMALGLFDPLFGYRKRMS